MSKPIFFTEAAEKELIRLKGVLKIPDSFGVKIEPVRGNPDDVPFRIGFDEAGKQDLVYEMNYFNLLIPKAGSMQIIGLTIDFIPEEQGFIFIYTTGS